MHEIPKPVPCWTYARHDPNGRAAYWQVPVPKGEHGRVSLVDPLIDRLRSTGTAPARVITNFPHEVLDCDLLVIRSVSHADLQREGDTFARLEDRLFAEVGHPVRVALLDYVAGGTGVKPGLRLRTDPRATDGDDPAPVLMLRDDEPRLLRTLRAIELHGNLLRRDAIQRVHRGHFELPSGTHADSFVRIVDVLDSHEAIGRLVDWLPDEFFKCDVLLTDTWTLLPLLQEVRSRSIAQFGGRSDGIAPPIITFDGYPTADNTPPVLARVEAELRESKSRSIGLVFSVVSTGESVRLLEERVREALGSVTLATAVLINAGNEFSVSEAFVRLNGIARFAAHRGHSCALCTDVQTRTVIRVDPHSYCPAIEPVVEKVMLRADMARRDQQFWTMVDRAGAVRVHVTDSSHPRHWEVWLDVPAILKDSKLGPAVASHLRGSIRNCDVAILAQKEPALEKLVADAYGPKTPIRVCDSRYERDASFRAELLCLLKGKKDILLLDDALVWGKTIRSLHRFVLELLKDHTETYRVSAYVVIARPKHDSVWKGLDYSLRQGGPTTLDCYHRTFLPAPSACVWCDEDGLLKRAKQTLTKLPRYKQGVIGDMLERRMKTLEPSEGLRSELFVCDRHGGMPRPRPADHITRGSVFGEKLGEAASFAAVSAAMHRIRDERGQAETNRRETTWFWDVPLVVGAYHDPLLQASFLRAALPGELNVPPGRGLVSAIEVAMGYDDTAATDLRQWSLLAAEHMLAVAMQKYPANRHRDVTRICRRVLEKNGGEAKDFMPFLLRVFD